MEKKRTETTIDFLKTTLVGFLAVFLFVLIIAFSTGCYYFHTFTSAANLKSGEVLNQVISGIRQPYSKKYLNLLILGLDKRPEDNSLLTDTILVASFNVQAGDYLLFSVPRDLWLPDLKTKINALYYYGQEENPDDGTNLVEEKVEDILETNINYTMVLEMTDIEQLIDILGGVTVDVERSFTDYQYPKDDGSFEVMTVKFKKGKQTFGGEKALQFMRSRKSLDEIEGTDQARQARQKKVILAIKTKLIKSKKLLKSPQKLGKLFKFFEDEIKIIPELTIKKISSFWKLANKFRTGKSFQAEIPWKPEDENQILESDYVNLYGRYVWILVPKDNDWSLLSSYFQSQLP